MEIPGMEVAFAVLLFLTALVGWGLNLLSIPGNWLSVAAVALYAWLMPDSLRVSIGWPVVFGVLLLAVLGEVVEFLAGAMGAAKAGGTRRGALLALVGSFFGGFVGLCVGLPVPLIGSLLAILFFASLGALVGAMIGEQWAGRTPQQSWAIGHAAFWGRLFGTLGKILIGSLIVIVIGVALLTSRL